MDASERGARLAFPISLHVLQTVSATFNENLVSETKMLKKKKDKKKIESMLKVEDFLFPSNSEIAMINYSNSIYSFCQTYFPW